jgi:hypothetical protein
MVFWGLPPERARQQAPWGIGEGAVDLEHVRFTIGWGLTAKGKNSGQPPMRLVGKIQHRVLL